MYSNLHEVIQSYVLKKYKKKKRNEDFKRKIGQRSCNLHEWMTVIQREYPA